MKAFPAECQNHSLLPRNICGFMCTISQEMRYKSGILQFPRRNPSWRKKFEFNTIWAVWNNVPYRTIKRFKQHPALYT